VLVDKIGKTKAEARVKRTTEARRQWRLHNPTRGELLLQCSLEAPDYQLVRSTTPFNFCHDRDNQISSLTTRTVIIEAYVGRYICDALLPVAGLAIEVYGGVHCLQTVRDACRRRALERTGLRVLVLDDTMTSNQMRRAIVAVLREK
jgi:very-short-patch-repair endonuclease